MEYLLRKNKNPAHQNRTKENQKKKRKEVWQYIQQLQFSSVPQSCSTLVSPWRAADKPPCPSPTWSPHIFMSLELVMPSNHVILCHPLLLLPSIFPNVRAFSNESALCIRWPSTGVSVWTSVLPMHTQDWSPLGWTGWIASQSKGLSRMFSNTTVQSINSSALSFLYGPTLTSIHDY